MIWVAALVAAVYFFMVDRSFLAFVAIGFAFAFKQQAVFLGPFLLVLVLRRAFPWRHFLIVPAVYVISVIPAFLGGGSGRALLTVYLDQADKYSNLTLFAPTVYQWLPDVRSGSLVRPAAIWGTSVLLLLVLAAVVYVPRLTPELILALATASVLVTPFVLPRMHDRYFFAADVLTIVLAFWVPRLVPVALLVQMVSLFSYWPFLFEDEVFSGPLLAVFELVAVVALLGVDRDRDADAPVSAAPAGSAPLREPVRRSLSVTFRLGEGRSPGDALLRRGLAPLDLRARGDGRRPRRLGRGDRLARVAARSRRRRLRPGSARRRARPSPGGAASTGSSTATRGRAPARSCRRHWPASRTRCST